ncbi:unnamed protein product [Arabidopsis halleri]
MKRKLNMRMLEYEPLIKPEKEKKEINEKKKRSKEEMQATEEAKVRA